MNYRELQAALRPYKEQGKTSIMLTSTKGMLEAELERLESAETVSMSQMQNEQVAETEIETLQPTDAQDVATVAKIKEEEPYIPPNYQSTDDVQLTADDVDAEIETFLGDVAEKKLSEEQLEAIAIALTLANDRSITTSEALAQAGQFRLFTPNQLLSWGFDHIIPRPGMLARFRDSITKSRKRAIVTIKFSPNPENAALLTAWAVSYKGIIYCRTSKDSHQHEEWGFQNLDVAEQFTEYCQKLSFVQSATIDRIGSEQKAIVGVG